MSSDDIEQPAMQAPEVYASIEAALASTARLAWQEPWQPLWLPAPAEPVAAPREALPVSAAPVGASTRIRSRRVLKWLASALVVGALLAFAWQWLGPPAGPEVQAMPPPVALPPATMPPSPTVAAVPTPPPALELLTDAHDSTEALIAAELARVMSPAGTRVGVQPIRGLLDGLSAPAGGPTRLAIAHYDALQDARQGNAAERLQVVMPLYTEELHFIVRADSPLRFIHQIEGRRINIGPAQSGGALTAATLYERMFGQPMPRAPGSLLGPDAALAQLLAGDIDVMVVVEAQPSAWLAGLPPQTASSLKLLALDRNSGASRKALRSFLPASVRAGGADTPSLAVMSFLVAADSRGDTAADERIAGFARSLCDSLPQLRRDGHPKWRDVQPALKVDVGWPYAASAEAAWRACAGDFQPKAQGGRP